MSGEIPLKTAPLAEMVDAPDLGSGPVRGVGSSPTGGTASSLSRR